MKRREFNHEHPNLDMKRLIALLLLLSSVLVAQDNFYTFENDVIELQAFTIGTPSARGFDPRYRGGSQSSTPIKMIKKADTVILTLTVSSDSKKPDERIKALQDALRILKDAGAKRKDILVKTGYVELPLVTSNRLFSSSAKTSEEVSSFDVTLVAKMKETDSVFDRTAYLNSFIEEIQFGKGVSIHYVSSGIALTDPDQHRKELLKLIGEEHRLVREIFGPNTEVDIKGARSAGPDKTVE